MPNSVKTQEKVDVHELITQQFIDALEKETIPWRRTWTRGLPKNLVSKVPYHGINLFLLSLASNDKYYVTFNQARQLGGYIKKGAKSIPIVYWNLIEVEERNSETGEIEKKPLPVLRYYRVFGISQTGDLEKHIPKEIDNPIIASSQEIISRNNPKIEYGRNPSYNPILDVIRIPDRNEFDSSAEYYSTLFHELGHWTGHKTRLNREEVAQAIIFGSSDYSKEELTAELTASFLCSVSGIRNTSVIENEIAYIQSWIEVLKRDKKFIISAGSKAKKAADFLLSDLEEEPEAKSCLLVLEPPPSSEKKTIER